MTTLPHRPSRRLSGAAVLLLVLAALILTGCGGDDGATGAAASDETTTARGPGGEVRITARDISFDDNGYEVPAGPVTVEYVQEGTLRHTLIIEQDGGEDVAGLRLEVEGSTTKSSGTVVLEPGTYTVYCDVAGHRQAGMEADLLVRETATT